jgi:hypothetical protein
MFIFDGENRIPLCGRAPDAPDLPEPPAYSSHTSSPPINQCLFGDCRASMQGLIASGVKVQTVVARRHNRHWLGCELNPEYGALQRQRLEKMK